MILQNEVKSQLATLLEQANQNPITRLRLKDWSKSIRWMVDGESYDWAVSDQALVWGNPAEPALSLNCSAETLGKIVSGELLLFIAIWVTGDIQYEGSFADAYKLGYLFLDDARKRRVVFLTHCFLNINTRFPQGCAFAGANVPLVNALLKHDLGIIQMPCPEFICLGLEKERYGELTEEDLRFCFRSIATGVVNQIEAYLELGYEIPGVIGMNPSPSCGVEVSKGVGTMLGLDRDTSEKPGPGVFIEEMQDLLREREINNLPIFGIRRILPGETDIEERIEHLERMLS